MTDNNIALARRLFFRDVPASRELDSLIQFDELNAVEFGKPADLLGRKLSRTIEGDTETYENLYAFVPGESEALPGYGYGWDVVPMKPHETFSNNPAAYADKGEYITDKLPDGTSYVVILKRVHVGMSLTSEWSLTLYDLRGFDFTVTDHRDAEAPAYEDKRTPDPVEPRYDREVQVTIVARGFYKVWLLSRGSRYALWVMYRPGYDNGGNNYSSPQWLIAEAKEARFAMKTFPCYYTPEKKTYSGTMFTPDLFEFIESQLATRPTPYARWDSYGHDWYTK